MSWHGLPIDAVLTRLRSTPSGLAPEDAAQRLLQVGPNHIDLRPPASAWTIFARQFRSVVVLLLIIAAVIAAMLGDAGDAVAIGAVLVINALLGFVTELRAHRATESLRRLEVRRAQVIRSGRLHDISARELVPGDVIALESGQAVPADARLLQATELRTNEALLTGESLPVAKEADRVLPDDTSVADRVNMVYQSTAIINGVAHAVVTATGGATEVGRVGILTSELPDDRTPLEQRLDTLGRRLVVVALLVAAVVAAIGLLRGEPWWSVVQTGIALAIAAVPEGLPAVATVALAVGVHRMSRRRALVRRLPSVETLGSATVVCTDKTGTLTAGLMSATVVATDHREYRVTGDDARVQDPVGEFLLDGTRVVTADDPALSEPLRVAALANRATLEQRDGVWRSTGDPTEIALLALAAKGGMTRRDLLASFPDVAEIPFSSERQWMATAHRVPAQPDVVRVFAKGAPGRIIDRCTHAFVSGVHLPLDDAGRAQWRARNEELAARGLRVLALASLETTAPWPAREDAVRGLSFLGLVGITDPPAPGVLETIGLLRQAGVRTVMITGDQRRTAEALAQHLGLSAPGDEVLDGRALAALDDHELAARLDRTAVFNRVSPLDKLRIVGALQARGEIVAMLGDGVNDAAALKKADIGVAMGGRGTDVAKDAADLILADDRFATIGAAVEEGRVIFENVRKFVFYLFSCNVAEILVMLGAVVIGLPQPLLPTQILWLNLLTDTFPALALAVEPGDTDVMARPPRDPGQALLSTAFVKSTAFYAVLMATITLVAYVMILREDASRAGTVAFVTLALAQALHLGNARSVSDVLVWRRAAANRWALAAVAFVIGMQVLAVHNSWLAQALRLVPLTPFEWGLATAAAVVPAIVGQALKLRRRH